jgi:hypothetical protein
MNTKFRIYSPTKKIFIWYGDVAGLVSDILYDIGLQKNIAEEGLIWQQFTDLYDKNNKEIYEGDILSCYEENQLTNPKGTAEWYNKLACWGYKHEYGLIPLSSYNDGRLTVIGNIFENPELLNV